MTEPAEPGTRPGTDAQPATTGRRHFLRLLGAGGTLGALASAGAVPVFAATPPPRRPAAAPLTPPGPTDLLWYPAPAAESAIIQQGLPVGNGRIGGLTTGDPARDVLYVTDASLWTGGPNATLGPDGQPPYTAEDFGTLTLLATVELDLPDHTTAAVTGYRRTLDLANGLATAEYTLNGTRWRREVFASAPDDVVVIRLTRRGGGTYTGGVRLTGRHGETTTADPASATACFGGTLPGGLSYAAAVTAAGTGGTLTADGDRVSFTGCSEVTVVVSGGTDYAPDPATGFRAPGTDPLALARAKAAAAAAVPAGALLAAHTADHRRRYDRMRVDLGTSTAAQRALDTWSRLNARAAAGAPTDPELEATYLQFGRYLLISGSRGGLPMGLQGLWLDRPDPAWMGDYHTDINVQMNYWPAERTGLADGFDAFAGYLLAQIPVWTRLTRELYQDPRNGFRNSSGRVAGWTTAISTNIYGGLGWRWHPAGNAWLCNSLWQHYEYTQDRAYLERIYPALKGACAFWEARLLTTTVTDPATGATREVLIDDADWSPEQGPTDARGITYAQELVWDLFEHYRTASVLLGRDAEYRAVIAGLQERLYLPRVSPTTGWLEEWMTPDDLGDPTHRHLSPLIGLFPGDRIRPGNVPAHIIDGATALLTARGMQSFGWACAWRALCWARLGDAEKAYALVAGNLRPSIHNSNGTAMNLFDIYSFGSTSSTFQIDANFGTPAAMVEMLLYSRPGVIGLLPALPKAWAARGRVTGIGARGGLTVDLAWQDGRPTEVVLHGAAGRTTTVTWGTTSRAIRLGPAGRTTLRGPHLEPVTR